MSIIEPSAVDEILQKIPLQDVRNFCLIAHIDHGKSSLSSRMLEWTGNMGSEAQRWVRHAAEDVAASAVTSAEGEARSKMNVIGNPEVDNNNSSNKMNDPGSIDAIRTAESTAASRMPSLKAPKHGKENFESLDSLSVEQERGITVKASTASMLYPHRTAIGPTGYLLLNLYDTPGHVDFGREVSRVLSFVQGAVLLLDSTQGIQAQTLAVHDKVQAQSPRVPHLIIALTKIDLPAARPHHVAMAARKWLQWDSHRDVLMTSARQCIGIAELLDAIASQVPPPQRLPDDGSDYYHHDENNDNGNNGAVVDPLKSKDFVRSNAVVLRAQVVDSWYDTRGVNCLVQIVSGQLAEGDRVVLFQPSTIASIQSNQTGGVTQTGQQYLSSSYPVQEVGIVTPSPLRTKIIRRGQLGYVRFGLRDPRQAMAGTVLIGEKHAMMAASGQFVLPALPSSAMTETSSSAVLYATVHPEDADGFEELCNAVDRLALNDTGLEVQRTGSSRGAAADGGGGGGPFLGPGLRIGFQGLLHMEVFRQRLHDEYHIEAVVTPPKVPYLITYLPSKQNKKFQEPCTKIVEDLVEWPEPSQRYRVMEPVVHVKIVARVQDAGAVMELIVRKRGTDLDTIPMDEEKWLFTATLPWAEVVTDFHHQLKNATSGYGSIDTSTMITTTTTTTTTIAPADRDNNHDDRISSSDDTKQWQEASLSKVDIMLNGEVVEPLAFVCHKDAAQAQGRAVCQKLQQVLPRQQFVTVIQATADGRILAAERIRAYRKDVLTKSGKTVGGGDQTRKMKLLEKQKKGKKRMQQGGKVTLSQDAFNSVISRTS